MHIRPINVCIVVLQENSRDQQTHQTTSSGKMYVFTKLHGNLLDTNMDIIVSGAMWGTVISGGKKRCKLSKKWSSRETHVLFSYRITFQVSVQELKGPVQGKIYECRHGCVLVWSILLGTNTDITAFKSTLSVLTLILYVHALT